MRSCFVWVKKKMSRSFPHPLESREGSGVEGAELAAMPRCGMPGRRVGLIYIYRSCPSPLPHPYPLLWVQKETRKNKAFTQL